MENYTMFEEYELPSKGEIYEEKVSPIVKLRSMTVNEEMKRLAKSDRPYKVFADIIDACIIDPIGISSYDLCIGDFEFLLHKLRIVTYGPTYKITIKCPRCFAQSEETIDLNSFVSKADIDSIKKNIEFELPKSHKQIRLKVQTPRMLDNAKMQAAQFKKTLKDNSIGDSDIIFTLKGIIDTIDGEKPDPIHINDELRSLPMLDTALLLQKAQKINDAIGLDTSFDIVCDICGLDYKSPFRLTPQFFEPTFDEGASV